jgi:hypothetical protein
MQALVKQTATIAWKIVRELNIPKSPPYVTYLAGAAKICVCGEYISTCQFKEMFFRNLCLKPLACGGVDRDSGLNPGIMLVCNYEWHGQAPKRISA